MNGEEEPDMKASTTAILLIVLVSVIAGCGGATTAPQTTDQTSSTAPTSGPTAGHSVGSGGLSWVFEAGEPVDVTLVLETGNTVEALIPVAGGTITATGADGSVYTLAIPAEALLTATTIGLTPVTSISGMPFGGDQTYAVQLSPEGLFLQDNAILTIKPAEELAVDQQIIFEYLALGKDVILAIPVVDSSEIKINVLHFSGYGATNGTDAGNLGGDAGRRLSSAIGESLGLERERQLQGASQGDDPEQIREYQEAFREYEEQVVNPRVAAAGESCEAGRLAIETVLGHARQSQLLGYRTGDEPNQYPGLYDTVARVCIIEAFERCVENHTWTDIWVLYDGIVAQSSLYSAGTLAEARDLTIKCVTFRLVFESTATADYQGLANYKSSMEAEVILRYNPGTGFIGGNGEYMNTSVTGSSKVGCTVAMTPGGGTIAVLTLLPVIELGPLVDGDYPDARIADIALSYAFGPSGEQQTITCPRPPGPPSVISGTSATWSLSYYDAHIEELEPGWALKDWEMEYGDLYATREWDKVGTVSGIATTEAGSFELYHEPGG
jgi:hypothetical protein